MTRPSPLVYQSTLGGAMQTSASGPVLTSRAHHTRGIQRWTPEGKAAHLAFSSRIGWTVGKGGSQVEAVQEADRADGARHSIATRTAQGSHGQLWFLSIIISAPTAHLPLLTRPETGCGEQLQEQRVMLKLSCKAGALEGVALVPPGLHTQMEKQLCASVVYLCVCICVCGLP